MNKLTTLSPEERAAGVVAASAGNHGQAVAWAARQLGIRATIFVPVTAPMAKIDACRNYGAATEMAGEDFEDALDAAIAHVEETGGTFIHPYEDQLVVAGQGNDRARAARSGAGRRDGADPDRRRRAGARHRDRVASAQARGAHRRRQGRRRRVHDRADGIAVKVPSDFTMPLLEDLLDDIVAVTDEQISEAIVLLLERAKLVVEGAGAVGVAALLAGKDGGTGTAVPILSGGNIDPTMLISVMRHGLSVAGRYLVMRTQIRTGRAS